MNNGLKPKAGSPYHGARLQSECRPGTCAAACGILRDLKYELTCGRGGLSGTRSFHVDAASRIAPAELGTFEWRGKPVWVVRRTEGMLKRLESLRAELIDPDSEVTSQQPVYARNPARSRQPELFVAVGLCTHLGCVPGYHPEPGSLQPGWPGGFYCPCHGSKFDLAGRVYRGSPAPTNLVVPPHSFTDGNRILIGEDESTSG